MTSFFNPILPRGARKASYDPYQPSEFDSNILPTDIYGLLADSPESFLRVDAAIDAGHEATMEITQHPVEIGADVTDFAIVQPRMLVLNGRISAVKPVKEGFEPDPNEIVGISPDRVSYSWSVLEEAMRNRRVLTIVTPLKLYENVLIRELRTNQDARTVHVLDFVATIQEIITVAVTETKFADEEIAEGSAQQQASPPVNRGEIQATDVEDDSIPSRELIGLSQ